MGAWAFISLSALPASLQSLSQVLQSEPHSGASDPVTSTLPACHQVLYSCPQEARLGTAPGHLLSDPSSLQDGLELLPTLTS